MKELKLFIVAISILLILYFFSKPMSLGYYFNDPLGRTLSLLYILLLTSYDPFYGLLFSIFFIGIYNSKVKPFEGMESITDKKSVVADKSVVTDKSVGEVDKKPKVTNVNTSINTSSLKKEDEEKNKTESALKSSPTEIKKELLVKAVEKEKSKEGYENIHTSLLPSFYGTERDKIVSLEKIIRPKPSNSFIIMNHQADTRNTEPMSFYYGKSKESFANMASV
jgi:hypothetical protein